MKDYTDIPDLEEIVLEESYVLGICAKPGLVVFDAEFVLGREHPAYRAPVAGESDCFARGTLTFLSVSSLTWDQQGAPPATDAAGQIDYGHIDGMTWEGDHFALEGDWGRMALHAGELRLELRV
jgi:hypothetical protein